MQGFVEASNLERSKYELMGDKAAEVYRTDLLRRYQFPVFPGETFVHEAIVWNAIARDGYRLRWHNQVIYHCEYFDEGLSARALQNHVASFEGYTEYMRQWIEHLPRLMRLRAIGSFAEVAKVKGLSTSESATRIGTKPSVLGL